MSEITNGVEWGEWSGTGDGEYEQRYIQRIVVDGDVWESDGGQFDFIRKRDGVRAPNAMRGEVRRLDRDKSDDHEMYSVWRNCEIVYGDYVAAPENERDAEDACREAIREALEQIEEVR